MYGFSFSTKTILLTDFQVFAALWMLSVLRGCDVRHSLFPDVLKQCSGLKTSGR